MSILLQHVNKIRQYGKEIYVFIILGLTRSAVYSNWHT